MNRPVAAATAVLAAVLVTEVAQVGPRWGSSPTVAPAAPVVATAAPAAATAAAAATTGPAPAAAPAPTEAGEPVARPADRRAEPTARSVAAGRWQWPARPRPSVARPFRAPASAYGAGHRGLDLWVPEGTAVLAVEAGRVVHAGRVAGRGTVSVEHHGGLRSTYEPVTPVVGMGDVVAAGTVIGTVRAGDAPPHCRSAACLHLGARRGWEYVDPLPLLAGGRLALLPPGRGGAPSQARG